jgi:hypothetical protein
LNPIAVSFTHQASEDTGGYFAFFRCPVNFDAQDNRIILSQEVVDKRLPSSNPLLAQLNDQIMIKYLVKSDDNIIERAKIAIIDQLPKGHVTDTSFADALYLTRRTEEPSIVGFNRKMSHSDLSSTMFGWNWRANIFETAV